MAAIPENVRELFSRVCDDPDVLKEYDIWVQSDCGRSQKTLTLSKGQLARGGPANFGVWTGEPCLFGCLMVCVRRVGSLEVKQIPASGHKTKQGARIPIPIDEGVMLVTSLKDIEDVLR